MTVKIIGFCDRPSEDLNLEPIYSKIWSYLNKQYGNQINQDGNGSCFRSNDGQTVVLTDNSLKSQVHQLVLIDVSAEVSEGLEEILKVNKGKISEMTLEEIYDLELEHAPIIGTRGKYFPKGN